MAKYYKKPIEEVVIKPRFTPPEGWGKHQNAIFDAVTNSNKNIVVKASPGSGKTTVLVESAFLYAEKFSKNSVLVCSFNKNITEELQTKLDPNRFDIVTAHAFGYRIVKSNWGPNIKLDKYGSALENLVQSYIGPEPEKKDDREALKQLVKMSKTCFASSLEEVSNLAVSFGIESSYSVTRLAEFVVGWEDNAGHHKGILEITKEAPLNLRIEMKGKKPFTLKVISYEDMIWLPIIHNWQPPKYDLVICDEVQDQSLVRRNIIYSAMKSDGRLFAAGDPDQAIYSWAGAEEDSLDKLAEDLDALIFPLPVSRRCAKKIVEEAYKIIPSIEARSDAPEGKIENCQLSFALENVAEGDVIISRLNAPLVKIFFALAKQKKNVVMLGREFGDILCRKIIKWHPISIKDLIDYNENWREDELEKREKKLPGMKSESRIEDEFEVVDLFCKHYSTIEDLLDGIREAFSPDEDKNNSSNLNKVVLTSTHKFKGLERNRVFLLLDTYKPEVSGEERRLLYVGITRAINELYYVTKDKK